MHLGFNLGNKLAVPLKCRSNSDNDISPLTRKLGHSNLAGILDLCHRSDECTLDCFLSGHWLVQCQDIQDTSNCGRERCMLCIDLFKRSELTYSRVPCRESTTSQIMKTPSSGSRPNLFRFSIWQIANVCILMTHISRRQGCG